MPAVRGSPCKSIIWTRRMCKHWSRVLGASKAGWISWSTMYGERISWLSGTYPCASTPWKKGLRLLRLAIDTHIMTSHFALPLLIKNTGGLVVEMTDGTADYNHAHYRLCLFYDLAKTSVIRIAWAQAQELQPHHCTAVALTPGWLRSEMMLDIYGVSEANWRDATAKQPHFVISETPRYVGRAVAALAADPEMARWSGQSLSSGQLAKVYGFTDLDGSQPDAWRYMVEVQDAGKPADATGYR